MSVFPDKLDTKSKNLVKKFSKDHSNATVNSNIQFTLIYEGGKLELLSTNYNSYFMIHVALNELEKHKKNLKFD